MPNRFSHSLGLTLDTNSNGAVTTTFSTLDGSHTRDIFIVPVTGTHVTHQVQVQGSPDEGTTWFDMWTPITGKGMLMGQVCQCGLLRAKVTTVEGAASTCKIYFFGG